MKKLSEKSGLFYKWHNIFQAQIRKIPRHQKVIQKYKFFRSGVDIRKYFFRARFQSHVSKYK